MLEGNNHRQENQAFEVIGNDGQVYSLWAYMGKDIKEKARNWAYRHSGLKALYLLTLLPGDDVNEGCWDRATRTPVNTNTGLPRDAETTATSSAIPYSAPTPASPANPAKG